MNEQIAGPRGSLPGEALRPERRASFPAKSCRLTARALAIRTLWCDRRLMRPLWKGAISFGLVTIPVSLYPATRREELTFRMLRKSDLSPINYKRVAEAGGKEVPWKEIVKGYEYEKGKYVVLKEDDFARVDVEATQTVDITNFVKIDAVDPLLFYKPYYLEVAKAATRPTHC